MFLAKQITSLEKVRQFSPLNYQELTEAKVLRNERFSYQIAMRSNETLYGHIRIESPLSDYIKTYRVEQSVMDKPTSVAVSEIGYITTEPGLMPDLLTPHASEDIFRVSIDGRTLWVEVNVPADIEPGVYPVNIYYDKNDTYTISLPTTELMKKTLTLEVLPVTAEEQSLIYTRWFYADCIANYHGVEIYSDRHFELIEAYIREAVDIGINMILVPIHTPPLDTGIGTYRRCVQLVDIKKTGDRYEFGFEKFRRFIDICKRAGVKYFEMAHMFSQWGAHYAANIMVEENGKRDYMFGWNVAASDPAYIDFLKQYIAAIAGELDALGIAENTYFHVSDEPTTEKLEAYKMAVDIIRPIIKNSHTFDALCSYEFYEKGIVECPVTAVHHINEFLKHDIPNQWAYYCCEPQSVYTNSLMAMPSWRTRILGVLLYKFDIKGFLHWGMNFYNCSLSYRPINPYLTSSSDGWHPSGDPFIMYPAQNGANPSIRGKVTFDAIGDMNLCRTLERYIGRDEVIKIIDEVAGMNVRFDSYPLEWDYIPKLREVMLKKIKELAN